MKFKQNIIENVNYIKLKIRRDKSIRINSLHFISINLLCLIRIVFLLFSILVI